MCPTFEVKCDLQKKRMNPRAVKEGNNIGSNSKTLAKIDHCQSLSLCFLILCACFEIWPGFVSVFYIFRIVCLCILWHDENWSNIVVITMQFEFCFSCRQKGGLCDLFKDSSKLSMRGQRQAQWLRPKYKVTLR